MKVTLSEASTKYGGTPKRRVLLNDLKELLDIVCNEFSEKRILLYGSFISDKPEPEDIDVMLSIETVPDDKGFDKYHRGKQLERGGLDIFATQFAISFEPRGIQTAEQMIEYFNSQTAHLKKGISCSEYVEIACENHQ